MSYNSNNSSFDDVFWVFSPLILGCCLMLVFFYYVDSKSKDVEYIETIPIASMQDASAVSGNFVLGTGMVETKTIYRVYVKNGEYLEPKVIQGDNIKILRDSSQEPHIKYIYDASIDKNKKEYEMTNAEIKDNLIEPLSEPKTIVLVVPEDAVELNFKLDDY